MLVVRVEDTHKIGLSGGRLTSVSNEGKTLLVLSECSIYLTIWTFSATNSMNAAGIKKPSSKTQIKDQNEPVKLEGMATYHSSREKFVKELLS